MENFDREVFTLFAEDLLRLLTYDLTGSVVRIDNAVPDLEVDQFNLTNDLYVPNSFFF